MTGSNTDNPIIDTTPSGEETASVDTSNSSVDGDKTTTDPFLDGLGVDDVDDGPEDTSSNSEEAEGNGSKDADESKDEGDKTPEDDSNNEQKSKSGRPDKRTRQIDELMRANAEKEAEIARLRQVAESMAGPKPPVPDADGNYTAEDMFRYQQENMDYQAKQLKMELEQKIAAADEAKAKTETIGAVERIVTQAKGQYKVLDPDDSNYDPEVDAFVKGRTEDALAPYMATGSKDYNAMVKAIESSINDSMKIISRVSQSSAAKARTKLDSLREGSSLISNEMGASSSSDDDAFLQGFNG